MNTIIGEKIDSTKFCLYDSNSIPGEEVNFYTIKNLAEEQIEEIKKCSTDELQEILSKYI